MSHILASGFVTAFAIIAIACAMSFGIVHLNDSLQWGLPAFIIQGLETVRNVTLLIVVLVGVVTFMFSRR